MTTGNIFIYLFTLDAVNWDSRGYMLGERYTNIFVSIKEDIEHMKSRERTKQIGTLMVWFATCHYFLFDAVFLFLLVDT